jgi:hypothetical protein
MFYLMAASHFQSLSGAGQSEIMFCLNAGSHIQDLCWEQGKEGEL